MRREAEIMCGTVFEHAPEPAYVMDPRESCIVAANDAGCALLGYTRDELLATPISHIHPCEVAELSELLARVLRDGRASTIALTCRTKRGMFLPTESPSTHWSSTDGRGSSGSSRIAASTARRPLASAEPLSLGTARTQGRVPSSAS